MKMVSFYGVDLVLNDGTKWDQLSPQVQQELVAQVKRGMIKPVMVDSQGHVIAGEEVVFAAIKAKVKSQTFVVVAADSQGITPSIPQADDESGPSENSPVILPVTEQQCQDWAKSDACPKTVFPRNLDRFCVFVNKPVELKRVLDALREIDPTMLPNRKIAVRSLVTLAHEEKAKTLAAQSIAEFTRPEVQLRCGDFRQLGTEIPDSSVQGLVTDCPYSRQAITLYYDSAVLAGRVLVPGGLYIAYAGKMYLPQVYAALERSGLEYVWQCAITHNTGHNITWPRRMISGYKPILIYRKPGGKPDWSPFLDICAEGKQEQDLHPWQQALSESEYFIRKLFTPGSKILDPMMGSGTTIVAAINCGVNVIGMEQDPVTYDIAKKRIEEHLASVPQNLKNAGA